MSCQTVVATLFSCSYHCYSRNHVVFPIQTCIQSFYPKSLYSSQTWPYIFGNMFRGSFQPSFEQFSLRHVVCLWLRDCATTLLRIHLCGRPWRKDCFHMKNRKKNCSQLSNTWHYSATWNPYGPIPRLCFFHVFEKRW